MNEKWSLDPLYRGFDDPALAEDLSELREMCGNYNRFAANLNNMKPAEALHSYIQQKNDIEKLAYNIGCFAALSANADTGCTRAMSLSDKVSDICSTVSGADSLLSSYVSSVKELDSLIEADPLLKEHEYYLHGIVKNAVHILGPKEEEVFSLMSMSGADAWEQLQSTLTSTVKVDYKGGTETLSGIRNLAYSPDAETRKSAYEAELKAYEKIRDGVAFSLNSIKLQTVNECRLRGYSSPLDRTLCQAHMKQESLDALLEAMKEYMPMFRRYLKIKAKALGHENGLPWYDLFAPLAYTGRKYTVEDAENLLLDVFGKFDGQLHDMVKKAFSDEWIDFYPRDGKVGGAFCEILYSQRQSRVLTNFGGEFGDVNTLAHELGHAFHNEMLFDNSMLNQDLPMQLAETASTFNENLLSSTVLKETTDKNEKILLIEDQLMNICQVICDIYSRYLFEKSVMEQRCERFLSADDLCELMLKAQDESYGDGLDRNYRHPYMWLCKSHYYSGSLSYYNFPYAFGGLFARSLYMMYVQEGASFVPKYKKMLKCTTLMDAEEAAAICGADITSREFWEAGLKSYEKQVDELEQLLK